MMVMTVTDNDDGDSLMVSVMVTGDYGGDSD